MKGVKGDPDGMRDEARNLRRQSEKIVALATQIDNKVNAILFEGKGGDRFRSDMSVSKRNLDAVAQQFYGLSNLLFQWADVVERRQVAYKRAHESDTGGAGGGGGGW